MEENIGKKFRDTEFSNDFLAMMPKALATIKKIGKLDGPHENSHRGAVETNLTRKNEVAGSILASLSELRIWHCCELWHRSQMRLGS